MKIVKGNVFNGLNDQNRTQALKEGHSDSTTYRVGVQVPSDRESWETLYDLLWLNLTRKG